MNSNYLYILYLRIDSTIIAQFNSSSCKFLSISGTENCLKLLKFWKFSTPGGGVDQSWYGFNQFIRTNSAIQLLLIISNRQMRITFKRNNYYFSCSKRWTLSIKRWQYPSNTTNTSNMFCSLITWSTCYTHTHESINNEIQIYKRKYAKNAKF